MDCKYNFTDLLLECQFSDIICFDSDDVFNKCKSLMTKTRPLCYFWFDSVGKHTAVVNVHGKIKCVCKANIFNMYLE